MKFYVQIKIDPGLVIRINDLQFEFNLQEITDSQIGTVYIWGLKIMFTIFSSFIQTSVALLFSQGFPMGWILDFFHLDFVDLQTAELRPFDQYYIFFVKPKFNL